MSQKTRTLYVDRNSHANSNAQICAEIVSSARFDNLANSNLPLKTRGAKGERQVRISIKVETVKKLSPAQEAAAQVKAIDNLVEGLSEKGWEHLMALCTAKARKDIKARVARNAEERAAAEAKATAQ